LYYIFFLKKEGTSKSFLFTAEVGAGVFVLDAILESVTGFLPNGLAIFALALEDSENDLFES
jgi:hypothetical protein